MYRVNSKLVLKTEEKLVIHTACFENTGKVVPDSAGLNEKILIKRQCIEKVHEVSVL